MACKPGAVLRIEFSAGGVPGVLLLQHDGTFRGGNPDWNGLARFMVCDFNLPPSPLVHEWDPRVIEVPKDKASLKINMWEYQIDPNSDTEGLSSDVGGR